MKKRTGFAAIIAVLALAACSESASVESESGAKLTLVKPAAVTLHRGEMVKAEIKIRRHDLAGDVRIAFANLPKGVDVVESDNRIVGDAGSYTLRASDEAELVENHAADVTASAEPGNISVSEPINITVKQKD